MRRLLLALPLVFVAAGALVAEPGESKEFKDKNFTWTLPSKDWAFKEVSADAKQGGWVVGAECREDGGVLAEVRVVSADGLKAEESAEEIATGMKADFKEVKRGGVTRGTLSGLDGALAVLDGTHSNGAPYWVQGYAIVQEGMLHQLVIRAFNGAQGPRGKEIAALKRAYRLIKGAGPQEAEESDGVAETPHDLGEAPKEWPPGGPKLVGSKVTFPSHNLEWTLPEGSPFSWAAPAKDERVKEGLLLAAVATLPRAKPGDGEPTQNRCEVALVVGPLKEGATVEGLVNSPGVLQQFTQGVFGGHIDASKTKITSDIEIGNVRGGRLTLAGAKDKEITWFIFQVVTLKSEQYEWRITMTGGKEIREEFGTHLGALFKGVHFPDTKEAVRGPVAVEAVRSHIAQRGHSQDKEIKTPSAGMEATKPKGLWAIPFEGGHDPAMRLAWEARGADGQTYFYFDVHGYPISAGPNQPRKAPEDVVKERETQWRTGAGDDAVTVTKGKEPWWKGNFNGADGVAYRFTGSQAGHPFVEQGWVVGSKNTLFWIRVQYGGAGAEKSMEPLFKAARKGIKFP